MKVFRGYNNTIGPISHYDWIYVTPDINQAKWYATKDGDIKDGAIIEYEMDDDLTFLSLKDVNDIMLNYGEKYTIDDLLWYQEGLSDYLCNSGDGIKFEDPYYKGHMIYILFGKEYLKYPRILNKEEFNNIQLDENVIKSRQGVEFVAYHGSKEPNMTPRENYPLYLCDDYDLALAFAKGEVQNDGLYDDEIPTIFTFKGRFDKPYYMPEDQYDIEGQDSNIDYEKWVDDGYDGIIVQSEGISKYYIVLDTSKIKLVDKKEFPEYSNNYEDDEEFLTENDEIYNDDVDITDKEPELGDSLKFQIKDYLFEIEHLKDEEDMGGEEYYETYIYTKFYRPDSTDFFWNIIGSRIERSWEGCLRYIETFKKAHNLPIITLPDETGAEYTDLDESIVYGEMKDDEMFVILHNPTRKELKDNGLDDECRIIKDENDGYYFASSEYTHEQIENKLKSLNLPYIETFGEFYYYQDNLFATRDDWNTKEEYEEYKRNWYNLLKSMPYIVKNFDNFKVEIFKSEYLNESVKPLEIKNSPKIYEVNSLNDIKGLLNKFKFGARGIMNNNTGHIFICDNDELIHHHLAMIVNKNMEPIETYSKFAFYNDYDKALDSEYANGGLWGYDWELYSDDDLYVWMCENDLSGTALQLTANMDYIEPPEEKIQNWMPLNESARGTESFKKWFNGSKVVDKQGRPLVVYHGTNADEFNEFQLERENDGFYFTTDKKYADSEGKNVIEAYLNIKNPRIITYSEETETIEEMKKEGYDGIFITDMDYYVAFYPNQIKSIKNGGRWDGSSNNIYESVIRRDDGEIGGYYTYNANELMSIIENRYRNDDVRVLYDIDKKIYMVGDAYSTIHFNLLLYMILFTDIYDDIPEIKDNKYVDDTGIQDIVNDRLYLSHFKVYRNNQNISDKEFIKYLKSMPDNKVDGYSRGYICKLNNKLWAICRDDEISEALQVPLLKDKEWIDLSKNKQLDESKNINTRKNPIYVSDSFEDVLLTMKTRNLNTIKVVYDESIKKYIYGKTKYFVHWSLILHALENGLYPNADKIENLANYSIYHSNKCDCFAISVLPKEHSLIEDDLYPSKTINMYNMSFYIYNNKKEYIKKLNEELIHAEMSNWDDDIMAVVLKNPSKKELSDNRLTTSRFICFGDTWLFFDSMQWIHEAIYDKYRSKFSELSNMGFYDLEENEFIFIESLEDDDNNKEEIKYYTNKSKKWLLNQPYIVNTFGKDFNVRICGEWVTNPW